MKSKKKVLLCAMITTLSACNGGGDDAPSIEGKLTNKDKAISTSKTISPSVDGKLDEKDKKIIPSDLTKSLTSTLMPQLGLTKIRNLKISPNSQFLAVSNDDEDTKNGRVNIYQQHQGQWKLINKLTPSADSRSSLFGNSMAFSRDGKTLSIGSYYASEGGLSNIGKVYLYKFDGENFKVEQNIQPLSLVANANFGRHVNLSADGQTLLVSAPQQKSVRCTNEYSPCGTVYVYKYDPNQAQWNMASEFDGPDNDTYFGYDMALSGDGSTAIISNLGSKLSWYSLKNKQHPERVQTLDLPKMVSSVALNQNGLVTAFSDNNSTVYLYTKKEGTYKLETTIEKPISDELYYKDWQNYSSNGYDFGSDIALNSDGTVLVATSFNDDFNHFGATSLSDTLLTNVVSTDNKQECPGKYGPSRIFTGASFVYLRQNQKWNLTQYLKPPKIEDNQFCTKGYNGPNRLDNDRIVVTVSDDNKIFQSTIGNRIVEYK
ncbi:MULTISPECIES: WD40 repeat domain-containing protein [Bacteria]|uniref:Quinoprotein amine dehydrogenase beta chain n=3 Tax=Photobacterium damselae TaxID=38293 RepID=D0Z560_PHODD|nr:MULTISPECIES: hypothetical protein [Bacteria]EEZ39094.1 quinoprotein amine dehydrogenase beta chain [Photobacterium damselae subsp. damselae CIP 102761]KAB1175018.1 lactonase family protein [Photobacterium damselae subsp. damselae]KAB1180269.1 lactonase family protein [Photobacterium damselae subsp. damselae]MBF7100756.1 lactonase family protein [Photobacterium damselae]NVO73618.1 hypothetical protein [Photobacterium damselae subsp. damselae]